MQVPQGQGLGQHRVHTGGEQDAGAGVSRAEGPPVEGRVSDARRAQAADDALGAGAAQEDLDEPGREVLPTISGAEARRAPELGRQHHHRVAEVDGARVDERREVAEAVVQVRQAHRDVRPAGVVGVVGGPSVVLEALVEDRHVTRVALARVEQLGGDLEAVLGGVEPGLCRDLAVLRVLEREGVATQQRVQVGGAVEGLRRRHVVRELRAPERVSGALPAQPVAVLRSEALQGAGFTRARLCFGQLLPETAAREPQLQRPARARVLPGGQDRSGDRPEGADVAGHEHIGAWEAARPGQVVVPVRDRGPQAGHSRITQPQPGEGERHRRLVGVQVVLQRDHPGRAQDLRGPQRGGGGSPEDVLSGVVGAEVLHLLGGAILAPGEVLHQARRAPHVEVGDPAVGVSEGLVAGGDPVALPR